ncbi:13330_t:CDS:2, partial [Funneliformis caledonium]
MATTTRSKYKQMLKEAKKLEERNLAQEITEEIIQESESDSDYEDETDIQSENSCANSTNNTKTICQIEGYEKILTWCDSSSSMKIHLLDSHNITKAIAIKYNKKELTCNSQQSDEIKPYHPSKQ